ncbi:porin family protein [Gangjinia marincola]
MKKALLLLLLSTSFSVIAQTQPAERANREEIVDDSFYSVRFGFTGGFLLSSVSGDNADSFDPRTSYHIGLTSRFRLGEESRFTIHPSIIYARQGYDFESDENTQFYEEDINSGSNLTIKLTYIHFPILLGYEVIDNLRVMGGPQIGFRFLSETELDPDESDTAASVIELEEYISDVDISLSIGAEYFLTPRVGLGIRYTRGLNNINGKADEGIAETEQFNNAFYVSATYLIR